MATGPKIAFIGAGSTIFMRNILGDVLRLPALARAHLALMDIDKTRLSESEVIAQALIKNHGSGASYSVHHDQRAALTDADFVIVAFQIGGYEPCTVTDFSIPKKYDLWQTIADTIGIGGIMRGLRTVPHLWQVCEDMRQECPNALLLQYVNPMAINVGAIARRYPDIAHVGLCHSVPYTIAEIARDLKIDPASIDYQCAGINHVAFFLSLEQALPGGKRRDLYPLLQDGYARGELPREGNAATERCHNAVRYEMMRRTGYFVTESSEHFAEYVPWFIKAGREDLIEKYRIPLDEYPKRCEEQMARWQEQFDAIKTGQGIDNEPSQEYAAQIIHAVWTDSPAQIYGNVMNSGIIPNLPENCVVEVPCQVDGHGIAPLPVPPIPPHLVAIMRSNINVQELTIEALLHERIDHIYHAAMMDPHTGSELDLEQIWSMVDELLFAHRDWLPAWTQMSKTQHAKTSPTGRSVRRA
ncbi:MAG: alpha-glucosidase/alpha-galactosidase [Pseudomonadota bacterium]